MTTPPLVVAYGGGLNAAKELARIRAAAVESCLWEDFCAATGAKRQASGDWMLNPHVKK